MPSKGLVSEILFLMTAVGMTMTWVTGEYQFFFASLLTLWGALRTGE